MTYLKNRIKYIVNIYRNKLTKTLIVYRKKCKDNKLSFIEVVADILVLSSYVISSLLSYRKTVSKIKIFYDTRIKVCLL